MSPPKVYKNNSRQITQEMFCADVLFKCVVNLKIRIEAIELFFKKCYRVVLSRSSGMIMIQRSHHQIQEHPLIPVLLFSATSYVNYKCSNVLIVIIEFFFWWQMKIPELSDAKYLKNSSTKNHIWYQQIIQKSFLKNKRMDLQRKNDIKYVFHKRFFFCWHFVFWILISGVSTRRQPWTRGTFFLMDIEKYSLCDKTFYT